MALAKFDGGKSLTKFLHVSVMADVSCGIGGSSRCGNDSGCVVVGRGAVVGGGGGEVVVGGVEHVVVVDRVGGEVVLDLKCFKLRAQCRNIGGAVEVGGDGHVIANERKHVYYRDVCVMLLFCVFCVEKVWRNRKLLPW